MNDPDGYHLAWYGLFFQYKTFTPTPPFLFSLAVCQERAALHGRRVKDETSFCQGKNEERVHRDLSLLAQSPRCSQQDF